VRVRSIYGGARDYIVSLLARPPGTAAPSDWVHVERLSVDDRPVVMAPFSPPQTNGTPTTAGEQCQA